MCTIRIFVLLCSLAAALQSAKRQRKRKRVRSACKTRANKTYTRALDVRNACAKMPKRVCKNAETRSLGVQNACARRPKRVRSACETRLPYTLCLTGTVYSSLRLYGQYIKSEIRKQ